MNYSFEENEMPFDILERFGLTQTMIEDLPTDVLQNIYNGRKSPVLPVHITADDGEEVKARTRFSLVRTEEGGVDVLFYPQLDEYDLKLFNETQNQNLLAGKPIIGHLESNEVGKLRVGEHQHDVAVRQRPRLGRARVGHVDALRGDAVRLSRERKAAARQCRGQNRLVECLVHHVAILLNVSRSVSCAPPGRSSGLPPAASRA